MIHYQSKSINDQFCTIFVLKHSVFIKKWYTPSAVPKLDSVPIKGILNQIFFKCPLTVSIFLYDLC